MERQTDSNTKMGVLRSVTVCYVWLRNGCRWDNDNVNMAVERTEEKIKKKKEDEKKKHNNM